MLRLPSFRPPTVLGLSFAFAVSMTLGCGGSTTDPGGASSQRVSPGDPCTGEFATASDGCNTCTCTAGIWACTKQPCVTADAGPLDTGASDAAACTTGATRPSDDGCNTCSCSGGQWACTEKACVEAGSDVVCGGWAGNTCSAKQYCGYTEGQMCGAADASALCRTRPDACDTIYAPICGCDGKTYGNDCSAASTGTGVLHKGPC